MVLTEKEKEEIKQKVIEALKETYDPEIPVNVYDLGLIYKEKLGSEHEVKVNLVWDPPWTPKRVTPEGRKLLKELFGYDIVGEWIKQYGG